MPRGPMQRNPLRLTRFIAVAAASTVALLAGACESPVAYQPAPAWRLDGTRVETTPNSATAPQQADSRTASADQSADPSTHKTYVYRGGRDPKTGRAYIQM